MISWIEMTTGFVMLLILLTISIPMDVEYHDSIRRAAYNPVARFVAISVVVALALYSPFLALLGTLIVFFWLADIQLLSRQYRAEKN
jgi:uncharacterized iron-regulated membrane protein